jgi:hypothetical protein
VQVTHTGINAMMQRYLQECRLLQLDADTDVNPNSSRCGSMLRSRHIAGRLSAFKYMMHAAAASLCAEPGPEPQHNMAVILERFPNP